jgi:Cu/Ag efflux protein CusF
MNRIHRVPGRLVSLTVALLATGWLGSAALAQQKPSGAVVTASEPGRAAAAGVIEARARVMAIDKATRTLTLKGARKDSIDVVAGPEVKNFDQIRVGDEVVVRYAQALSLELRKTKGSMVAPVESVSTTQAAPGARPSAGEARQIHAIADVTQVDQKAGTITLKGPRGNSVTLAVRDPAHFKVVKQGDQVEVTYTEAVAVAVEPARPAK